MDYQSLIKVRKNSGMLFLKTILINFNSKIILVLQLWLIPLVDLMKAHLDRSYKTSSQ